MNMYVYLFQSMVPSKALRKFQNFVRQEIKFIIDSAQAHGAYYEKSQFKISNFSDIYIFDSTKKFTSISDAGAICFNKDKHFKISSLLREHGWEAGKRNESKVLGFNQDLMKFRQDFYLLA